mgnify:CR=1 FL=1
MKANRFKLLEYASMAACVLSVKTLGAQAIYTDLDPDMVVEMDPEVLNIDMNGDGILDFAFLNEIYTTETSVWSFYYSYFERIWAGPKNPNNAIAGSLNQFTLSYGGLSTYYYPYSLPENAPINGALEFQNDGYQMMAFRTFKQFGTNWNNGGNWYPEITDHYLGVRFLDTLGCNHYGWIRCDVLEEGRVLVVKDYAYETKCDTGILAGDTIGDTTVIVNIENNLLEKAKIWSESNNVHIQLLAESLPIECEIFNLAGQFIYRKSITKTSTFINFSKESKSIYIVSLTNIYGQKVKRKIILH